MICPNCGSENNDKSKFCKKCGSSLKNDKNSFNADGGTVNNAKESSNTSNILIISITVIICLLIVAGAFVYLNAFNQSSDSSSSISDSSSNVVSTSDSSSSTINSDGYSYNVQGVNFIVPNSGYMRTSDALRFTYNGHNCEVERVPEYEVSSSNWDLNSIALSQDYQGGEPYLLIVNNHPWIGIKIQKGGHWYHISMNTDDVNEAESLLSWMNEHNTWSAP